VSVKKHKILVNLQLFFGEKEKEETRPRRRARRGRERNKKQEEDQPQVLCRSLPNMVWNSLSVTRNNGTSQFTDYCTQSDAIKQQQQVLYNPFCSFHSHL
jgi:hypothetical protein